LFITVVAGCASVPAPPYAAATQHAQLGPRDYVIDVELGKSRDLDTAVAYANRRASELCDSGYDLTEHYEDLGGRNLTYDKPESEQNWVYSRLGGLTCWGCGEHVHELPHVYMARISCRTHGL
jgi:hypothetical protein